MTYAVHVLSPPAVSIAQVGQGILLQSAVSFSLCTCSAPGPQPASDHCSDVPGEGAAERRWCSNQTLLWILDLYNCMPTALADMRPAVKMVSVSSPFPSLSYFRLEMWVEEVGPQWELRWGGSECVAPLLALQVQGSRAGSFRRRFSQVSDWLPLYFWTAQLFFYFFNINFIFNTVLHVYS